MSGEEPKYNTCRINQAIEEEFDETEAWEKELKPLFDALVTKCEELDIPSLFLIQWQAKYATEEELANFEVDENAPRNSIMAINRPANRPNELIDGNIALLKGEAVLVEQVRPKKNEVWVNHPGSNALN